MIDEVVMARVFGGMHFQTSVEHGAISGKQLGRLVVRNHFRPVSAGRAGYEATGGVHPIAFGFSGRRAAPLVGDRAHDDARLGLERLCPLFRRSLLLRFERLIGSIAVARRAGT
jgi:hypothetical protein